MANHAHFYKFKSYPWGTYLFSFIILIWIIYLITIKDHFILHTPLNNQSIYNNVSTIFIKLKIMFYLFVIILLSIISFILILYSKIEELNINKKDNTASLKHYRFFIFNTKKIDIELSNISGVSMRYAKFNNNKAYINKLYYIRIHYKKYLTNDNCYCNKIDLHFDFGFCLSFKKLSKKYQYLIALVYNKILKEVDKNLLIKDNKFN